MDLFGIKKRKAEKAERERKEAAKMEEKRIKAMEAVERTRKMDAERLPIQIEGYLTVFANYLATGAQFKFEKTSDHCKRNKIQLPYDYCGEHDYALHFITFPVACSRVWPDDIIHRLDCTFLSKLDLPDDIDERVNLIREYSANAAVTIVSKIDVVFSQNGIVEVDWAEQMKAVLPKILVAVVEGISEPYFNIPANCLELNFDKKEDE